MLNLGITCVSPKTNVSKLNGCFTPSPKLRILSFLSDIDILKPSLINSVVNVSRKPRN